MIKEVVVVEGRDDIDAVKRAVDCELIATGGFGFPKGVMERIKTASVKRGIIIFTDPDFAGEKIRKKIASEVPGCKHAFLPRESALKDGDIGVENASPESIKLALSKVRTEVVKKEKSFDNGDLMRNGLVGSQNSSVLRDEIGKILGIGYGNSKQFLSRLNNYGVTREEFENALKDVLKFNKEGE
ncbi:ribonuclease M5 [Peptostreptococcus porci]|uniref:Ribonuclease M5 n=1 Tax=Peptostreptococcus porci TaxID=2652282 RepID=A0A6N7XDU9_9FIRM|nr:ribonuclease M5 [Peptostreptococcus porci]MDD7183712.1 ribonuclease M5 [Peptostreptococcus porci]MDY2794914.1 ribonuclease M5 [Peptostreptococcus porci]MDY4129123.1 ribonuclease M5 [Peptostreptococcus porci]MDY5436136.1 ribonuclease M5 [Peptostreptococcus porci]MDY5480291.1 ribonuclease M5 [Peptostreptococcus porci]